MTLLAPWAVWFAAVGAAVVALYVLKIKRRQQVVPALEFWRELAGRTKVHSLFERLRRLLSMLLWLVIAACLILALGNPLLAWGKIKPRAIAIIIDNSASMQATEPGEPPQTRLDLARQAVRELTTRRPVNDQWLLIEAAREPRVLSAWTHDHKAVNSAAAGLEPFQGSGNLAAAIDLANELSAAKDDPCIVLITDGAGAGFSELTIASTTAANTQPAPPTTAPVAVASDSSPNFHWPIGSTRDNLGIAQLSVRLHRQQSANYVYIRLVNSSPDRIDTPLTLHIDGAVSSVELVSIDGQSSWEKTMVIDAPEGGVLRATIDRADALDIDNQAFAVLEPIKPAIVWLVSPADESFFFEQALASMEPLVWVEESLTLSPEDYTRALASLAATVTRPADGDGVPASTLKRPDLVIFNNCQAVPLPTSGGKLVLVNSWPQDLPAKATGVIELPQLFIAPTPHPLTQYLNLQGVRLKQARRVSFDQRATVLAHSADAEPLIFLCDHRQCQMLCLAFDVLDSDMPFRNAFPLLLRNAVSFMHSEQPPLIKPHYRIGEVISPLRALPGTVAAVDVASNFSEQDQQDVRVPVLNARFAWSQTGHHGAVRITCGEEPHYAAINLADELESQIAPASETSDIARELGLSRRVFGAMPWIGFAALAAALLAVEWLTFHFRWTE